MCWDISKSSPVACSLFPSRCEQIAKKTQFIIVVTRYRRGSKNTLLLKGQAQKIIILRKALIWLNVVDTVFSLSSKKTNQYMVYCFMGAVSSAWWRT